MMEIEEDMKNITPHNEINEKTNKQEEINKQKKWMKIVEYGASNIKHAIDSSIYRSTKKKIDRTESQ